MLQFTVRKPSDQSEDDNLPLFVPQFAKLRYACRKDIEDRLKELEGQVDLGNNQPQDRSKVKEAKDLLREYGGSSSFWSSDIRHLASNS